MKNTAPKIDRATLLKGGGMAALGSVLMAASPRRNGGLCCDPIDLTYQIGPGVKSKKRSAGVNLQVNALRLVTRTKDQPTQPPISGWQSIGSIPAAMVTGEDGLGGKGIKHVMGYDIWVYIR